MGFLHRFGTSAAPDEVVDLREAPAEPQLGSPSGCDSCGGRSHVDHIDVKTRTQFEHCLECGEEWRLVVEQSVDAGA